MNIAVIRGWLSRDPEPRQLPSGDRVVNLEVTVRDRDPAESVPVIWVDPTDGWTQLSAGDEVVVAGRVRRRFFRAAGATASRTEVVADRIVLARHGRRVQALVDRVGRALGDASS